MKNFSYALKLTIGIIITFVGLSLFFDLINSSSTINVIIGIIGVIALVCFMLNTNLLTSINLRKNEELSK